MAIKQMDDLFYQNMIGNNHGQKIKTKMQWMTKNTHDQILE